MSNPLILQSLAYLKGGLSVIPLKPQSKEPLIPWQEFQSRRASESEIQMWFENSSLNLGIITGAISGIVVVDIDSPEGHDNAKRLGLISGTSVVTGTGRHFYFRRPEQGLGNYVGKWPGIDIRGDGGFVVGPPSLHQSGRRYTWVGQPLSRIVEIPLGPFIEQSSKTLNGQGWISEALEGIVKGNRNDTFAKIVGKLHRDKWSADDIARLLAAHCERVSFPVAELETIIRSITRYKDETFSLSCDGRGVSSYIQPLEVRTFADSRDAYQKAKQEKEAEIKFPTGFNVLDGLIRGLHRGEIFTVAARPGIGKTNWLITASEHLCRTGRSVLFFSTEMSFDNIWDRYIPIAATSRGHVSHKFFLCDEPNPTVERVEELVGRVKPDVVMFDHINFTGDDPMVISEFCKGLKRVARVHDIPLVMSAQLNRNADWVDQKTHEKVIPRLSMIKGSGTIEEVSAQVLLLTEMQTSPEQNDIIGALEKNRYGEKGIVSFVLKKNPLIVKEVV